MPEHLLTPEAAALLLGIHPETLRLWARTKRVPALKIGNQWRFEKEALLACFREHGAEAAPHEE